MTQHPWMKILLGAGLLLVGLPIALLTLAVVLLDECGSRCEGGAMEAGWGLIVFGFAAATAGALVLRAGLRENAAT